MRFSLNIGDEFIAEVQPFELKRTAYIPNAEFYLRRKGKLYFRAGSTKIVLEMDELSDEYRAVVYGKLYNIRAEH